MAADLPEGYKMTELGPLPEEWRVVALREVLAGVDVRARDVSGGEALPILSLTRNNGLILQTKRFQKRIATEDVSNYKVVRKWQVVHNPYVIWEGAVHALRRYDEGLVSPVYPVWEVNPQKAVPFFVDETLRLPTTIAAYNRLAAGAVNRRRSISKTDFLSIRVALPPLPEQKKIAAVLSAVQEAREKTEAVIAALRELKKSLMKHLFTYGAVPIDQTHKIRLKDTQLGPLPEGWDVARLGDLCRKPQYGYTASAKNEPVGPKMVRITDIQGGRVDWSNVPYCKCNPEEEWKYRLERGDILFARAGSVGKAALLTDVVPERAIFASYLIRVRVSRRATPQFIWYFMQSGRYWEQVTQRKHGAVQANVNATQLRLLLVPLPAAGEQEKIASVLSAVDERMEAEEKKKRALDALFKRLLNDLMTARIRVNHLEFDA